MKTKVWGWCRSCVVSVSTPCRLSVPGVNVNVNLDPLSHRYTTPVTPRRRLPACRSDAPYPPSQPARRDTAHRRRRRRLERKGFCTNHLLLPHVSSAG